MARVGASLRRPRIQPKRHNGGDHDTTGPVPPLNVFALVRAQASRQTHERRTGSGLSGPHQSGMAPRPSRRRNLLSLKRNPLSLSLNRNPLSLKHSLVVRFPQG